MSRRLRLLGDRVLIKMDPESDMMASGLLHKPEVAHDGIMRTAEVMQVGPGKWKEKKGMPTRERIPVGVEVGEGVVFIKFVADSTKTAQALQFHLEKDEAILSPNDVLLVYDRKNPPEFA